MTWSHAEVHLGRHEIRISPYLAGEYSLVVTVVDRPKGQAHAHGSGGFGGGGGGGSRGVGGEGGGGGGGGGGTGRVVKLKVQPADLDARSSRPFAYRS